MKKTTLLFLFLVLTTCQYTPPLRAQSGWFPLKTSPNSKGFNSIYFINADTGIVCTVDSGSYRTTDGGKTWTSLPLLIGSPFKFFNNNKLGYSNGGEYRSTDGGLSWVQQYLHAADIDFPSDSVGYFLGFGDSVSISIGKSQDGGNSWSQTLVRVLGKNTRQRVVRLRYIAFRDADHGFVALDGEAQDGSGGGPICLYTSDGGNTWLPHAPGGDQLLFLHDSTWIVGFFGHEPPQKTNDDFNGGHHPLDSIVDLDSLKFDCRDNYSYALSKCDTNNILGMNLYSGGGEITRSTDAGESWHIQLCFRDGSRNFYPSVSLPTKLVGYAVGVDSQIYKTIDGGGLSFHNDVKKVDQNSTLVITPNPTTGIISISGLSENILSVTVENILGKTIAEFTHPESPSLKLDLSQQPPGTYFARFVTAGAVVVRKITLK